MTALNDETRMTAHRLLDVVSVHQAEGGADSTALTTAVEALGRAEDQNGDVWVPESVLPASFLLVHVLIVQLAHHLEEDQDVVLGHLREWIEEPT